MTSSALFMESQDLTLGERGLASVTVSAHWSDGRATHEDRLHVEKLSVWREVDLLPGDLGSKLPGMQSGEMSRAEVSAGQLTGSWDPARQISTSPSSFDRSHLPGLRVEPRAGRFYPQGFFRGVGAFSETILPARIAGLTSDRMDVDLNHPLARFPLELQLLVDRVLPGSDRRGGRCTEPLQDLLRHPGFTAPLADGSDTDFGDDAYGLSRLDDRPDSVFYSQPRMVQHLDARARETANALYRRLTPSGARVLDLMASFDSHLQGVSAGELHVLGMNADELAANRAANTRLVQDLNHTPHLPFDDGSHDAVVCTASIEYLTRPAEVLAEVWRVLRPGGLFITTFSNRWFPGKTIRIWSEMHEFERLGMVTQWLQHAGFVDLHTLSSRGWPRPADDPHAHETPVSDPVYGAWGFKPDA